MASWFSRNDFLPAGLKAEQVELAGTQSGSTPGPPKPLRPVRAVAQFQTMSTADIGAAQPIYPRMAGRWN